MIADEHQPCPQCGAHSCHSGLDERLKPLDDRLERIEGTNVRIEKNQSRILIAMEGDEKMGNTGFGHRLGALEKKVASWEVMKAKAAVLISIGTAACTAFFIKMVNLFGFDLLKK